MTNNPVILSDLCIEINNTKYRWPEVTSLKINDDTFILDRTPIWNGPYGKEKVYLVICRCRLTAKTLAFQARNTGSIPVICSFADMAQLAEQLICNQQVFGSNPNISLKQISIVAHIMRFFSFADDANGEQAFSKNVGPLGLRVRVPSSAFMYLLNNAIKYHYFDSH